MHEAHGRLRIGLQTPLTFADFGGVPLCLRIDDLTTSRIGAELSQYIIELVRAFLLTAILSVVVTLRGPRIANR